MSEPDEMEYFEREAEKARKHMAENTLAAMVEETGLRSTAPVWKDPETGETAAVQPPGVEVDPGRPGAVLVPQAGSDGLTWGAPLVRIQAPEGIPAQMFRQIISASYQQYLLDGRVHIDTIMKLLPGIPRGRVEYCLNTQEFKAAARARGIEVTPTGLTPEMDYALIILTDPHDGLPFKRKLEKAQISSARYQAWMRNPYFRDQINALSEQLVANSSEALIMLKQKVGDGDMAAIKYQLELNGRYNPQQQNQMDSLVFMNRVLEIIATRVRDPDTLREVASDMKLLADTAFRDRTIPGTGI